MHRTDSPTTQNRPELLSVTNGHALFLAVVFASAETFLVQWTSYAVSVPLLWFGFCSTFVLFFAFAKGMCLLRAAATRVGLARGSSDPLVSVTVSCLVLYTAARLKAVGALPLSVPALGAGLVVILGWLSIRGVSFTWLGSMRYWLITAILYVSSVFWVVRAPLDIEPTTVAVILLTLAAGLNAAICRLTLRLTAPRMGLTLPVVLIALNAGLLAATYPLAPGLGEPAPRHQSTTGGTAGVDRATSVVLIVLDTVRADHTSLHGHTAPTTPNLETLANQAAVFTRAYANSTFSLPSHASLLTGLLPHKHGANYGITESTLLTEQSRVPLAIGARPLPDDVATIPEYMAAAGLATGLIAANHGYLSAEFGLQQGFQYADSRPQNLVPVEFVIAPFLRSLRMGSWAPRYAWLSQRTFSAPRIVDRALEWLDGHQDEPFFLMVNFMDVHDPVGTAYAALRIDEIESDFSTIAEGPSLEYDLAVRYLDHHLERLFEGLRARRVFDNSLVIITSDHGEDFMRDVGARHGRLPLEGQIHVPLLIKKPRQRTGERIDTPVHGVDILPTILATLGQEIPDELDGTVAGQGDAAVAEVYFARHMTDPVYLENIHTVRPTAWTLVRRVWKLTLLSDGTRQLSRPVDDPTETRHLQAEQPEIVAQMEQRLRELLPAEAFMDYLLPGPAQSLDDATMERLRSLGYIR